MAHARKQIRDAIVTLVTGLTTTGSNVFTDHPEPFEDSELPALHVYAGEDERGEDDASGALFHALEVSIAIKAKKSSGLQDYLDSMAVEVADAIAGESSLTALSVQIQWGASAYELGDEGERDFGTLTETYVCFYWTSPTDPETILNAS